MFQRFGAQSPTNEDACRHSPSKDSEDLTTLVVAVATNVCRGVAVGGWVCKEVCRYVGMQIGIQVSRYVGM